MRLFIAINFDEKTKQNIIAVQRRLQNLGSGKFPRPENLHLTLAFLGEVAPERIAAIHNAINNTPLSPIALTFNRTGYFRRDGGDLWWLGLTENVALLALQKALSKQLAAEGFRLESRRFSPHITLARKVCLPAPPDPKSLLGDDFSTQVNAISLMCSERIQGRLTYTEQYRKSATD